MFILHDILEKLKNEFPQSEKAQERSLWFVYTVIAIIVPFSSSKTSNIIRCLKTLFGFDWIKRKKFYTFMASPKIPWKKLQAVQLEKRNVICKLFHYRSNGYKKYFMGPGQSTDIM